MPDVVYWGNGAQTLGEYPAPKKVSTAVIATAQTENQTVSYSIVLSNWNMGGVQYGAYSGTFSYSKRLKISDLVYVPSSFFSGKTIISSIGSSDYPNSSRGYLAIEWKDVQGNSFYSLFAQTSTPNHFFQINTLTIRDATNNFIYYQDLYRDGTVLSNTSQTFNYSLSNWNSSGLNYPGYSGSFSTPVPSQVIELVSFRGAWTGGGVVLENSTYAPYYPSSTYGYNAVRLLGSNGITYIALIGQWLRSFSINTFSLTSNGWLYYNSNWTNTSSGFINNPPNAGGQPPYEGSKTSPFLGTGCAIAVTYTDQSSQNLMITVCPEWVRIRDSLVCPEGTCSVDCGDHICCYGCDGKAVLVIPK